MSRYLHRAIKLSSPPRSYEYTRHINEQQEPGQRQPAAVTVGCWVLVRIAFYVRLPKYQISFASQRNRRYLEKATRGQHWGTQRDYTRELSGRAHRFRLQCLLNHPQTCQCQAMILCCCRCSCCATCWYWGQCRRSRTPWHCCGSQEGLNRRERQCTKHGNQSHLLTWSSRHGEALQGTAVLCRCEL